MDAIEHEMQDKRYPVDEDIALQRRIWRFERVGWYLLLVVVLLTLCGLFSHGMLSSVSTTTPQGDLTVEYERFHRSGAVNAMVIHSRGEPGRQHTLTLSHRMMKGFSVESMQPQPVRSAGTREGLELTLPADAHGESTLYLTWRSDGLGYFKSKIGLEGGGQVSVTQFIYP
ncbi:hypothetical protein [Pseudomonas sp. NFR16]|uniref:hypothetical protein n=1 Tax=Pseudomonas sp. NFR16 TaxID=1566248 RepID=UPI0008B6E233|nr:hypothetical protein [Pseudomonas sp. NFR16]SEI52714.1 hypothetical protein SAMN03159495_0678 [Pseudomonas sp. NFR16]